MIEAVALTANFDRFIAGLARHRRGEGLANAKHSILHGAHRRTPWEKQLAA